MFFWKPGNACGGGERKGKVIKNLDFYYASGKGEGPRKGRWHAGKICRAGFYHEEKPAAYAGHSIFVFAAQADWMTTACILAGNPL